MARLYIGNLPTTTTENELQAWIEGQGFAVDTVQVIIDLQTGVSRGFAFAELPHVRTASEAVTTLNGQSMEGHDLQVSEARPVLMKNDARQIAGNRSPKKKAS